jgi:hypothetical protein
MNTKTDTLPGIAKPVRVSKQQKALRAVCKAAEMATTELDDIDLVQLRLEYIVKTIKKAWPKL